ncbi:65-kDa microtubule-associated protein 1, partial [Trichinella patagoniensis]
LEQLCKQKEDRIQTTCAEIGGTLRVGEKVGMPVVDENDLSLRKLDEFQYHLQELQKEK